MDIKDLSDPEAWNARYVHGQTGWDRAGPAPALVALLARLDGEHTLRSRVAPSPRSGKTAPGGEPRASTAAARVLVPGAGYGHDAIAWARAGYDVTAVDFAPLAVQGLRDRAEAQGVQLEALSADIFALPGALAGTFDIVWEQTCLCAIDPGRRDEYVSMLQRALVPGGRVYALLWNHERGGGPPFDLPSALAEGLFAPRFEVLDNTRQPDSDRAGEYLLTLARR